MRKKYSHDIIVIGAGSGGLNVAMFMNRIGLKVLLIDKSDESFGGDCLNHGCIPSKSLLHVANLIHDGKSTESFGFATNGRSDMRAVMQYVKATQDTIRTHENPAYFREKGLDVVVGEARFVGKRQVSVADNQYAAKHIVIATGSRPRKLELPGLVSVPHFTNETIFDIDFLPKEFVFIGGGPINIELGQAFSRLGSNVTILQSGGRILPNESKEVSELMRDTLEKEGITIHCGVAVNKILDGQVVVSASDDSKMNLPASALFIGIGRQANVEALDLKSAGVQQQDSGRIALDKYLRTSNKAISVVGDAAGLHMFTHAAELQAQVVLGNFFSPFRKPYSSKHMAWVTFTDPEIATFGASNDQLQEAKTTYETVRVDLNDDDRAITESKTAGFLEVYVSSKGDIYGGTMIGARSGEVTSELVLMMHANVRLGKVLDKPFPYPISSRVVQSAARSFSAKRIQSSLAMRVLRFLYH